MRERFRWRSPRTTFIWTPAILSIPLGSRFPLARLLGRFGRDRQALADVGKRVLGVFLVLQRETAVGGELDLLERLEHFLDVELAFAEDHAGRVAARLREVFEVNAEQA